RLQITCSGVPNEILVVECGEQAQVGPREVRVLEQGIHDQLSGAEFQPRRDEQDVALGLPEGLEQGSMPIRSPEDGYVGHFHLRFPSFPAYVNADLAPGISLSSLLILIPRIPRVNLRGVKCSFRPSSRTPTV